MSVPNPEAEDQGSHLHIADDNGGAFLQVGSGHADPDVLPLAIGHNLRAGIDQQQAPAVAGHRPHHPGTPAPAHGGYGQIEVAIHDLLDAVPTARLGVIVGKERRQPARLHLAGIRDQVGEPVGRDAVGPDHHQRGGGRDHSQKTEDQPGAQAEFHGSTLG